MQKEAKESLRKAIIRGCELQQIEMLKDIEGIAKSIMEQESLLDPTTDKHVFDLKGGIKLHIDKKCRTTIGVSGQTSYSVSHMRKSAVSVVDDQDELPLDTDGKGDGKGKANKDAA